MPGTLFKNALLITMNPGREVFHGDLLVENDRIAQIVKAGEQIPQKAGSPGGELRVIEASGCALLPGFVQTHIHLCQTLFRNQAENLSLLDWLQQKIWPFEAAHNATSMRISARLGIAELLAGGTTTILDMGSVHHYDEVFAEAETRGLRLVGGKCMMDSGDNVPAGLREDTQQSLRESEHLQEHWHGAAGGRLRYAYAPRFTLSCSEVLLREVAELAREQGCMVHSHAAETAVEEEILLKQKKRRSVAFFHELGIAGEHCCFAHGVQVHHEEMQMLAADGTSIAHCPGSNMKLASGLAPVIEMREAGVKVGLGADGAPCNNRLDIFKEMQLAGLIQKIRRGSTALPAIEIVAMATIEGARCLGLAEEIGSLEAGKKADVTMLRLDSLPQTPNNANDIYAQIVYAASAGDVRLTMVEGRVCYENGEIVQLDRAGLAAQAEDEFKKLLQRVEL